MKVFFRAWLIFAMLVCVASCSKCGSAAKAIAVERMLPKSAAAVVIVPSVKTLGERLRILETLKVAGFLGALQGFESGKALGDALVGQLGIDVRNGEAMKKAGLDADRALGVVVLQNGEVVLVLPVSDESAFHATLERISSQRFGAGAGGELKTGDFTVKTFSEHQGEPPRVGYLMKNGFALVATKDVSALAPLAGLAEPDSLATDEALKQSLSRVPADRLLFGYLPVGSGIIAKYPVTSAVVTLRLSASGLALAIDAPWRGDPAQLAMLELKQSMSLWGYLPKDTFAALRYQGDPAALTPVVNELLGPFLAKAFDEGGFNVKTEVLDVVKPGVIVGLSLADRPPMGSGMPRLDLRTTNPFSFAHLSGVALVNSGETVLPTLEKLAAVAPKFGATMAKVDRNGAPMLFTTYAAGEGVHFARKGDLVFFGSPVMRIDQLEAVDAEAASKAVPPSMLGEEAVALMIDLNRLATSVRELPASAWGIGGFAIKATTVRWLDATDDLKAVTASAGTTGKALQLNVALVFGAKPP